ncbi:MAG: AbrB family transcriptional regulator [Thermoprotei archaeon]|nr:MAG: AbrB family transcriptional regulator [Thermoprotei archaeon]
MVKIRVGKRGVIVIPKEIREKIGLEEGTILDLRVEGNKIILQARDLWSELRRRGRKLKFDVDEAEREIDEAEEAWLERLRQ